MSTQKRLSLTDFEKKRILEWANYVIENSLHWGNGAAMLPEEEIIIKKLKSSGNEITFNKTEIDIISEWFNAYTAGRIIIGEDNIVFEKIKMK